MNFQKLAQEITRLHADCIRFWKKEENVKLQQNDLLGLVEQNHAFNFQLWHAEDRARREDQGYEFVYRAKREIDHCNQQRNNRMEAIDEIIYTALKPPASTACPVHSETPGMMIDRLSILALKSYHMGLQVVRKGVSGDHQQACRDKLKVIEEQKTQLELCLDELLLEVQNKTRTFRVYHQFKMYNDPALNPELYDKKL
jgi:hypothetical protein